MATTVQTSVPLGDSTQLAAWLGPMFPHYKMQARGRKVLVVGSGAATGIGVVIGGPQQVKINWQFPNMFVQILLVLGIVLGGILPGLVVFLIVWLSVKDDVKRIEQEVTAVLQGAGAYPQPTAPHAGYLGQPQQGYPGQPQQGYPGQPQQGYPGQPQPGYPGQPQQGYPGQPQPGQPSAHHPR
jgi:phage shock protein PspC (stress-responsive transcriptional regulator)